MEPVPQTYTPGVQILDTELNDLCTRAAGSRFARNVAPGNTNWFGSTTGGFVGPSLPGETVVTWMMFNPLRGTPVSLPDGALEIVDDRIDYRDRMLFVGYFTPSTDVQGPSDISDYLLDYAPTLRVGYTGLGAEGAAGAVVVAGVPPVPAASTSWALQIATNVWLFADAANNGCLCIYNDSGAPLVQPFLRVTATGTTGARP